MVYDTLPAAKDALVFIVVGLNESWKACAYFFIDGLSGKERVNLVKVCIQRLHDVGVKVISLTCDGLSCHISMLTVINEVNIEQPMVIITLLNHWLTGNLETVMRNQIFHNK